MFCASASQQSTGKSTFNLVSASKVPSAMALPAMSSCMPSMCFAGFRLWPPVSKQMPLPTSASADLFVPAFDLSFGAQRRCTMPSSCAALPCATARKAPAFMRRRVLLSRKRIAQPCSAASAAQDDGIVHLRYTPKERSKAGSKKSALALVGNGICFDTGGHNLKPAKHMLGMHEDMAGSAVALGTLLARTKLKVDFPVDCWLALAQNMISPQAYKQNDIVTAMNGTTIEVVHTDAEGRMVLADTLALACREKPAFLIDYATLTGACMYALGTSYSGAFTNRAELLVLFFCLGVVFGVCVWLFLCVCVFVVVFVC